MKVLLLFWILLKGTMTSFAGLGSLPAIRDELVARHAISDDDVDAAVVISRITPGPIGVWVVATGYLADGVPGAIAGWLAMSLPSLTIILLMVYLGRRADHPRVRGMVQSVVLASAALLVAAAIPLGRDVLGDP